MTVPGAPVSESVTVVKRDAGGQEVWRYAGRVLARRPEGLLVEAYFDRADLPFMGTVFHRGDRFLESYFTDRWYNVYAIHDGSRGAIKGWYCNIARPAVLESPDLLSYVDLALDLWVAPDGTQTVLDREEFEALALGPESRSRAIGALAELQRLFKEKKTPGFA